MHRTRIVAKAAIVGFCAFGPCSAFESSPEQRPATQASRIQLAQGARACRDVGSCREAVILWCSGYRRADGDGDGIPCENVCRSRPQVEAIREEIGC